mmetsp:Transcript_1822/g.5479  ORF Transcript_1822/g.5479 Transcript_1822/m.5479 type:complete len:167 (+) Transcript_1822:161-661(+)
MKPAWDQLIRQYQNSTTLLVADVDCTADGKSLCRKMGVNGYPTIKYGDPSDLQDYKGGRGSDELQRFAKGLDRACHPTRPERCSEEEKVKIEEFRAMDADKRAALIKEKEEEVARVEKEFKDATDEINKKYKEESQTKDEAIKAVRNSGLNLLKAIRAFESKQAEL